MRKISQPPILIPSTSRTLPDHRNPLRANPSIQQLPPIRLPEIQPHRSSIHAKKLLRIPKLSPKLRTHLLTNRIATSSNTRPDRRRQILNSRSILLAHLCHPMLNNPSDRPAPPGVKCSHHSLFYIDQQHRNTIRRTHPQQHTRHVGDEPITLQDRLTLCVLEPPIQRPVPVLHHPHHPRVDLPHSHQRNTNVLTTNRLQKTSPVLGHQSRLVLLRPPKIQRISSINGRNPTHSSTKPVPHPPITLPPRYPNDLQPTANPFILNTQPATSRVILTQPGLIILIVGLALLRQNLRSTDFLVTCNNHRLLASTSDAPVLIPASKCQISGPGQGFP
jgi:hypothetical protein